MNKQAFIKGYLDRLYELYHKYGPEALQKIQTWGEQGGDVVRQAYLDQIRKGILS